MVDPPKLKQVNRGDSVRRAQPPATGKNTLLHRGQKQEPAAAASLLPGRAADGVISGMAAVLTLSRQSTLFSLCDVCARALELAELDLAYWPGDPLESLSHSCISAVVLTG